MPVTVKTTNQFVDMLLASAERKSILLLLPRLNATDIAYSALLRAMRLDVDPK